MFEDTHIIRVTQCDLFTNMNFIFSSLLHINANFMFWIYKCCVFMVFMWSTVAK